jgi:hypothetical protein
MSPVSNRARLLKNCRLEKRSFAPKREWVKKLRFTGLLETMPNLCFDGVATISNRGLRY